MVTDMKIINVPIAVGAPAVSLWGELAAETPPWHGGGVELLGTSSQKRNVPWTGSQPVLHEAQGGDLWRSGCFPRVRTFDFQKIKRKRNWVQPLGSKQSSAIGPLPNTSEKSGKSVFRFEASSSKVLGCHPAAANFRCSRPCGATHSPKQGVFAMPVDYTTPNKAQML